MIFTEPKNDPKVTKIEFSQEIQFSFSRHNSIPIAFGNRSIIPR